ncbi:hypothetical protein G3A56_27285 (plasmid) [Rhizobium oryzihabitans]|uniref:Uncharacterized protein n=1 Tax=Rhizobium oryzihabitans TaxID=2267833 RepID=A0A7L5BRS0_9HYPH|nr:hypothetical protein [Rhizobium oryzihabitans]QIB41505.1 hypothetical protein G3A56_27285 [Rhizobium oryzihabitans]
MSGDIFTFSCEARFNIALESLDQLVLLGGRKDGIVLSGREGDVRDRKLVKRRFIYMIRRHGSDFTTYSGLMGMPVSILTQQGGMGIMRHQPDGEYDLFASVV